MSDEVVLRLTPEDAAVLRKFVKTYTSRPGEHPRIFMSGYPTIGATVEVLERALP